MSFDLKKTVLRALMECCQLRKKREIVLPAEEDDVVDGVCRQHAEILIAVFLAAPHVGIGAPAECDVVIGRQEIRLNQFPSSCSSSATTNFKPSRGPSTERSGTSWLFLAGFRDS